MLIPRFKPLKYNKEVHVAKQNHHKNYLGNKFKKEVKFLFKIERIISLNYNTECHVDNGDDY